VGVEREQEPGYDMAVYVHRQGQPRAGGSPLRPPLIMSTRVWSIWRTSSDHAVFRLPAPLETVAPHRGTFCRSGHGVAASARLFVCGMPRLRVEARRLETLPPTLMLNSVKQCGVSKLLTHETELLDTCASAKASYDNPLRRYRGDSRPTSPVLAPGGAPKGTDRLAAEFAGIIDTR
jgi:hypothetical protein